MVELARRQLTRISQWELSSWSWPGVFRIAAEVLDHLILLYVVALLLIATVGGVDLWFLQVHQAAKPLLMIVVLVPTRIAIGGRSWLADRARERARAAGAGLRAAAARVPASVCDAAFALVTVRLASTSAAFLANIVFKPATPPAFTLPFSNEKFAQIFAAWDSGWYWDIAAHGYYFRPDAQSSIAFFPLYPLLMRLVAMPSGGGEAATWVAGIVVAFVAFVFALIEIHKFTESTFGSREVARRTVLYIVVFPWSLFMGRVYAEATFLLTTVLAIRRAWDERWWQAGMWGALATLTRPNGILIALPLLLRTLYGRPTPRQLGGRVAALLPIPVALAAFSAYAYGLTGEPFGWLAAQAHWTYSLGHPPWQQLQRVIADFVSYGPYDYFFISHMAPFELLQTAVALICVALVPLIFRALGWELGAYVLVSLLVPLSSNAVEGFGRYISVLFPAFMLVGSMTSARSHEAVLITALVFRTLLVCFFVTWQPIY